MCEADSAYYISTLNKVINLLVEAVEELKTESLKKYKYKDTKSYQQLDISLVTFKVGDLMRCKCTSN